LLTAVLVAALILGTQPLPAAETPTGTIKGSVRDSTGNQAVLNATVLAYHLSSASIYRSAPTNEKGKYEITGLQHGYYDVAVETADGLYVGNQVVNVPPDGKATASFSLIESTSFGPDTREFPGAETPTTGIAQYAKEKSKKGIALIAGGSLLVVLLLAAGGSSSSGGGPPSPSTPPAP
jgi:hypothetical protein